MSLKLTKLKYKIANKNFAILLIYEIASMILKSHRHSTL